MRIQKNMAKEKQKTNNGRMGRKNDFQQTHSQEL